MEKDNKYYGIIADIVKKHRKFAGLEAILDDIIDDVYNHSEVIINSVPNENVINAYIEKVVSTSIITVPKRMGFHSEIRHGVVSTTPRNFVTKNEVVEKVDTALVDKMINSAEAMDSGSKVSDSEVNISNDLVPSDDAHDDLLSSLDNELEQDNEEVSLKDEQGNNDLFSMQKEAEYELNMNEQDDGENELFDNSKVAVGGELLQELHSEESVSDSAVEELDFEDSILQNHAGEEEILVLDEEEKNNAQDSNEDLGDISNEDDLLAKFSEEEEVQNIESEETDVAQQDWSIADTQNDEILEEEQDTDILTVVENEDSIIEQSSIVENLNNEETPVLEEDSAELELDNLKDEVEDSELQAIEEPAQQTLDIENSTGVDVLPEAELSNEDLLQAEDSENLEIEQNDELLQVEGSNDLDLYIENDDLEFTDELSFDSNNDDLLTVTDVEENSLELSDDENNSLELQVDSEDEEKFVTTDFSKFEFNPAAVVSTEELDTDLIVKDIQDLANRKPELNVIDIYNMKYKENKSITEISTELGLDENSVIDTLNEIIAVI